MTGDVVLSYLDYYLLSGTGALQGIIDSFHVVVRRKGLRLPPALHQIFSRSAAPSAAPPSKSKRPLASSASAPLKSNRRAALSFECYKRKTETVWLQNNSYGCKPILWHDTRFFYILRSHWRILRSHCWIGKEHLYFPSGIGL